MTLIPSNKQLLLLVVQLMSLSLFLAQLNATSLERIKISSFKRSVDNSDNNSGYSIVPREYYKNTDYYSMLSYIFAAVKFDNNVCEYTFQNCLLNMNNQEQVRGYAVLSKQCFPLQKSRFCLQEVNFKNSDCVYKMAEAKVKQHFNELTKNLETCVHRHPNARSSGLTGSDASSNYPFKHLLFVVLVFHFFQTCPLFFSF